MSSNTLINSKTAANADSQLQAFLKQMYEKSKAQPWVLDYRKQDDGSAELTLMFEKRPEPEPREPQSTVSREADQKFL